MTLVDTNLLARCTDRADSQCDASHRAIARLGRRGERLVIVPQTVYEFWSVATRLVAAMRTHGMTQLLTFNGRDFRRLGATVIDPASV